MEAMTVHEINNLTSNVTDNLTTNYSFPRVQLYSNDLILAYNVFLSFIIAFGVPGNLLVLLVFLKMKISTSTDWFIIFITLFDFISSLFNVPIYLTFTNGAWKYYGNDVICKLHMYFSQVVVLTSALITCGLAVERYIKVCRPHANQMSRKAARNVCIVLTSVAVLASLPATKMHVNNNGVCRSAHLNAWQFAYYVGVFILFIVVFIVIASCYIMICVAIKISERKVMAHVDLSNSNSSLHQQPPRRKSLFGSNKIKPIVESISTSGNLTVLRIKTAVKNKHKNYSTEHLENYKGKSYAFATNTQELTERPNQEESPKVDTFLVAPKPPESLTVWTSDQYPNEQTNKALPHKQHHHDVSGPVERNDTGRQATFFPRNRTSRQSIQTTKIAFCVCTIYIVSWIIPWVCFILLVRVQTMDVRRFALFGRMTYLINTFTNPFLYAVLNVKFRQKLKACFEFCKGYRVKSFVLRRAEPIM